MTVSPAACVEPVTATGLLLERIYAHAEQDPTRDALIGPDAALSYGELANALTRQVALLEHHGISADAVVGIRCADDIQHLLLCLAATHLGATSCTIPSYEAEQGQTRLAERCHVTHLLDDSMVVPIGVEGPSAPVAVNPPTAVNTPTASGACLLFSTSGTTGEPKLVVHRDHDLVAQAHRHVGSADERFVCLASMEHNFAKRHRLYVLALGATNVFVDASVTTLVPQCLALDVNVLHVSAYQAQELLAHPDIDQLAHVRLKLGGGHVPLLLRQQLKQHITPNLQAGYGTTETGAIGFTDPEDTEAGESVGRALPGIEIRVVSSDRAPLATGEHGEFAIRCPGMFREYLDNPEATAARLADGWFYTGDIGYLDAQQRIHLCGRADDMFVFNSMNIYPQDIEATIREHPNIADAAVIPKASPVHGNIPVALLVFRDNVKQRLPEVQKFVHKRLGERRPRQYIIVPEIPKTDSGKISRAKALKLPSQSSEIRSDILAMLPPSAIEHLQPSLIDAFKQGEKDILIRQLEMDSLARMNFLVALELTYDVVITPKEFRTLRYLGHVVARVLAPAPAREYAFNGVTGGNGERAPLGNPPYVVRFFQRLFGWCNTVAQLNQAFTTLELRLVPEDVEHLCRYHADGLLLPSGVADKFQIALSDWLAELKSGMTQSGFSQAQPFSFRRVAPTTSYFTGPGSTADKTLLICFPPREIHQMGIPNPTLLQYTDAAHFDLLITSTRFPTGYHWGSSRFNTQLTQFAEWLHAQPWLQQYRSIRTLGFSAGGRTAIAMGHLLNAELAVSVSGRFHRKRYALSNLEQLLTLYRATRRGRCQQVLLSYTQDNPRDRRFADYVAGLVGGRRMEIRHQQEKLRHLILQQLLEQGELATYLRHTIFQSQDELLAGEHADFALSFPADERQTL